MRQGSVDPPSTKRVRVALRAVAYLFVSDIGCPNTGISQEETLVSGEAIDVGEGSVGCGMFISIQRHLQTAMVSKVLTQRELTVGLQPGQHLNISEIVDTYVGTLSETFGIAVGPPVAHVAILVIVASLVVEAVGHLMTYHHANSTIVEGIIGISIEERRLERIPAGKQISLVVGL